MSDDLVRKLREARYVAFDECGDYDLAQEAATALTEARAEIERVKSGINGIVNCQGPMTRAQVREVCAEILDNKTVGLNNQSPFAEAMFGNKARAEKAESALAEQATKNTNLRNDLVLAGMARDTAERAFTDICEELGCKADNEAALEAVAALKRALAKAVEALRPVASREMQNINDEVDNYGTRYQSQWFADAMAFARAFIAEHDSDSKGE